MKEILSGVYIIKNKINKKVYVGSSKNIKTRWRSHKRSLNMNKHHNYHLQNAWNKYGEDNFIFDILELVCDENKLIECEQIWMDKYKAYDSENGYNINPTAGSQLDRKLSEESKLKMRNSNKSIKEVVQLDIQGNFIAEFSSIKKAVNYSKFSNTTIKKSLKNKTFVKGFCWVLKSEYLSDEYKKQFTFVTEIKVEPKDKVKKKEISKKRTPKKSKEVARIDGFGNITIYKSISEACKILNYSAACIKKCCDGKSWDYKNFIWKYVEDLED